MSRVQTAAEAVGGGAARRCRQGDWRRQVEVLATIQDARVTMQGVRKNVLPVCKKINKNGFAAS